MSTANDIARGKGSIIREMFVRTADENYIVARWSFQNNLLVDFLWNSAHALEKYLKAALLFNDMPAKDGHSLLDPYKRLQVIAGDLLPLTVTKPTHLGIDRWQDMSPRNILETLERYGNPDNRYLTHGFVKFGYFIHMVDAMVWHIRRLGIPLNSAFPDGNTVETSGTYRDYLRAHPDHGGHFSMPLEEISTKVDTPPYRALLNLNFPFAPVGFDHQPIPADISMRNPVLEWGLLTPLSSDAAEDARKGYQLAEWLLANTKHSRAVKEQIRAAQRHSLIKHPGIDSD